MGAAGGRSGLGRHASFTIGERDQLGESPRGRSAVSASNFDRELRVLEEAIRRLSAEVDGFLYGTSAKPPTSTRRHVEEMIRRLNGSDDLSAAERYRFGTLQGRYSALVERWDRLQGEKESGRRPGLYGHFRESRAAEPAPRPAGRPNAGTPASVEEERRGLDAGGSDRDLFDRYVAAKKSRGEDVSGYRLEGFVEGLERERRKVRERLGEGEIVFDVAERDGRVRLVARKKTRSEE
jgi:hypothetical protein